jgi:hypothetical protein
MKRLILLCATISLASTPLRAQDDSDLSVEVVRTYDPALPNAEKIMVKPRILPDTTHTALPISYTLRNINPLSAGYLLAPIPPAKVQREGPTAAARLQGYAKFGLGYSLSTLVDAGIGGNTTSGTAWLLYANHYGNYGSITNDKDEKTSTLDIHNDIGGSMHKTLGNHNTLSINAGFAPRFVHYYGYNTDIVTLQQYERISTDTIAQQYLKTYASINFAGTRNAWRYGADLSLYDFRAKHNRSEDAVQAQVTAARDMDSLLSIGAEVDVDGFLRSAALADENHLHIAIAPFGSYRRNWWQAYAKINVTIDKHGETQAFVLPTLNFTATLFDGLFAPYIETTGRYLHNSFADLAATNPYISPLDTLDMHDTRSYAFAIGARGRFGSLLSVHVWTDYAILSDAHFFYNTTATAGSFFNLIYDDGKRFSANVHAASAITPAFEINATYSYQAYYLDALKHPLHKPQHTATAQLRYNLWNKLVVSAALDVRGEYYAIDAYSSDNNYIKRKAGVDLSMNAEYRFYNNSSAFLQLNNVLAQKYQRYNGYNAYGFGAMIGCMLKF